MYLLYRIVNLIYRGNFPMDVGCWLCQDVYNFSLYIHWCNKMRTIDRLTFISLLLSFEGWNYWEKIFIFHSSLRLMTYRMILVDQPCKHLLSSSLLITLLIPVDFFTVDYFTSLFLIILQIPVEVWTHPSAPRARRLPCYECVSLVTWCSNNAGSQSMHTSI